MNWALPTLRRILGKLYENRLPLVAAYISNNVPDIFGGELETPAAHKKIRVAALLDTGATTSVVDINIVRQLMLKTQNQKKVVFPNAPTAEYHPSYPCELFFSQSFTEQEIRHEWPDLVDMVGFDLSGRAFQAVIGMDIIRQGAIHIENSGAVVFEF